MGTTVDVKEHFELTWGIVDISHKLWEMSTYRIGHTSSGSGYRIAFSNKLLCPTNTFSRHFIEEQAYDNHLLLGCYKIHKIWSEPKMIGLKFWQLSTEISVFDVLNERDVDA